MYGSNYQPLRSKEKNLRSDLEAAFLNLLEFMICGKFRNQVTVAHLESVALLSKKLGLQAHFRELSSVHAYLKYTIDKRVQKDF